MARSIRHSPSHHPTGDADQTTHASGARPSRRGFLGVGATASVAAGLMVHSSVAAAAESRELRLGIVGCGGRGSGAVNDSLTINEHVRLVAAADLYASKCASMRKAMQEAHPGKVALDDGSMYDGLDGYKRVLDDPNVDVVLITTSPGFRPIYLRAAVEAGKHVFAEKPACVDPAGYRTCLEVHDAAVARGTAIVAGTDRGNERRGIPAHQLDALHLAERRSDHRTGRPQPRHHELGHGEQSRVGLRGGRTIHPP